MQVKLPVNNYFCPGLQQQIWKKLMKNSSENLKSFGICPFWDHFAYFWATMNFLKILGSQILDFTII